MTSTPTIGVLAVQGDVADHERALEAVGARSVRVRRPDELGDVDGLVVPGGESTVMDKLIGVFDLREPLQEAIAAGLPVYGSCAGMILLASGLLDGEPGQRTLGAMDVVVRRNAFGRQVASFETDLSMPFLDDPETPMRAVFIRAPWIESHGPEVEVLATVPDGPAAGRVVAVRQGNLLATSFHPEMTGDTRVHAAFVRLVAEGMAGEGDAAGA